MSKINNSITRRNFLKGAALSAAGAAVLGTAGASFAAEAGTAPTAAWSWETPPAPIPDADIVETLETEVLILGAGNAGCAAACSAAENGAQVLVCEKTARVNGRGGGVGACNSRLHKELGIHIDPIAAQYRWNRTCGNRNNEALVSLWFNKSGEAVDWVLDKADKYGATYYIFAGYSKSAILPEEPGFHMFGRGEFVPPEGSGGFVPTALVYADSLELGVTYLFEHVAEQLIKEGDRVTGAIVNTPDGYKKVLAKKAVILATGDIHGDEEMMECYAEQRLKNILRSEYTPVGVNTGDGHKMGMWAGAIMQDFPHPPMLHPQACSWFHGPFLFVNMEGRRFFNEGNWVQAKSLQIMNQPEHVAFSIFDSNYGEDTKDSLQYGGGMFWDSMSRNYLNEFKPEDVEWALNMAIAQENGFMADTLEELADLIGVNKENFLAEVENYNALCEAGVDTQFAKESVFLYPIKEGPFYAMKVGAAILAMVGGLKINTDLQCLDAEGNPIAGLYAIGNTSGDLYTVDYPINIPGNSNGRCFTWGYLIGKTVAAL